MTVLNPWQWYCSTRTFSNALETTLTIAALAYWPWELLADAKTTKEVPLQQNGRVTRCVSRSCSMNPADRDSLRISLVLAAVAVLLRPTNLLIWLAVMGLSLTKFALAGATPLTKSTLLVLVREVILCGTAVLAISLVSDRLYFGFWTFPPYKWLYFNISQSLAVFYGHMPWHYYLSQGVPLLTTTFLPFTLVGLYKATSSAKGTSVLQSNTLKTLALATLTMISTLSLISHKEVRFIYPLLPILHILAAPYIAVFFTAPSTSTSTQPNPSSSSSPVALRHKLTLINLLTLNLLLAGYLTLFHQPAPLSVLTFLRTDFERLHPDALALGPLADQEQQQQQPRQTPELFALFLTPCHTTPWRSHLVYPALRARALTCEPPLHTAPGSAERATYLDEADRFYLAPPSSSSANDGPLESGQEEEEEEKEATPMYGLQFLAGELWPLDTTRQKRRGGNSGGEEIPRYIVGFEGIEPVLARFFGPAGAGRDMGVRLTRAWSAWNGAFNEDWRRRGRLVVWDTGVYAGSHQDRDQGREQDRDRDRGVDGEKKRERVVDEL